jgi:hypothetical protein
MDASHVQLGSVISQDNKPIAFYSRKLQPAQTRYTTTERELLSIVETLKEFRNILLGQQIVVHMDHHNLTYKNFNTERVLQWRLIIKEFGPQFKYIQGAKNIVADALSRLEHDNDNILDSVDCYGLGIYDLLIDAFPVSFHEQNKDETLLMKLKMDAAHYLLNKFHGGNCTHELICYKNKIVILTSLQWQVVDWYHFRLGHPGINRTEETIGQHLYWPKMRDDITNDVS